MDDVTCGTITIDNATVYAYSSYVPTATKGAPGIGNGTGILGGSTVIPTVIISNNSEIHTHRSMSPADYIGWVDYSSPAASSPANSAINCGMGGSVTNSTVYCYTGRGDKLDKTVRYDAVGVGTKE